MVRMFAVVPRMPFANTMGTSSFVVLIAAMAKPNLFTARLSLSSWGSWVLEEEGVGLFCQSARSSKGVTLRYALCACVEIFHREFVTILQKAE